MKTTYLIPALLVTLLAGCASTNQVASNDPVRQRVLAELEQAKADGSYPMTEAFYANLPLPQEQHRRQVAQQNAAAAAGAATDATAAP
ncbi:MAG: hypothetical protein AB1807_11590 [Pseudomonadota bacterium]